MSDENLVAMDWLLSSAIGGVKVQVWEADVEKAVATLESEFGENGEGLHGKMTPEELAALAEAANPEDELPAATMSPIASEDPAEAAPNTTGLSESREDYSRRFAFAAMLGLVIPLFTPYAIYLFLNTAFGEGSLTSRGKLRVFIGCLMTCGAMIWLRFVRLGIFIDMFEPP